MQVTSASTMIIAPHQDDETFGCGGLIALKRRMGATVVIVFLTDGANSPQPPGQGYHVDLRPIRKQEAVSAARHLGVPADCLYFLNLPDSKLSHLDSELRDAAVCSLDALVQQCQSAEVFIPCQHEGLADHQAANQLVRAAIRQSDSLHLFEYVVWMSWLSPVMPRQLKFTRGLRLSIASVAGQKRSAINEYRSQLQALPGGFLSRQKSPYEVFYQPMLPASRA